MAGRLGLLLGVVVALTGCTTVDVARAPDTGRGRDVFVTTSDLPGPYKSLGVVQATRRGVLLFGFADPAGDYCPDSDATARDATTCSGGRHFTIAVR